MSGPVFEFANPNGRPDRYISENEAASWLLTQAQRKAGMRVTYNAESERWEVSESKETS